jgi:signal transduction histidine kinase
MNRVWTSVAFRLSCIYGGLVLLAVLMLSTAFYLGTAGVLARSADEKIVSVSERLGEHAAAGGLAQVQRKIVQALTDGVDSDTEIYLLTDPAGNKLAGNILLWSSLPPIGSVIEMPVTRDGRPSTGRVLLRRLPDQSLLVVGRDMSDLHQINTLIWRAIIGGGVLALVLSVAGTIFFRAQIEQRVGEIRRAALEIAAGDLSRRIPVAGGSDEFARLSQNLNRMLDKIEHLMDGVRHVSNTIAHNLRTPLGRIRGRLDEGLRDTRSTETLANAGGFAIVEIDRIIALLDKLLQIAEAESGARRKIFSPVSLHALITDLAELYDAAAEEAGVTLNTQIVGEPSVHGDRELLASALANLLDNALNYAGSPAEITVEAARRGRSVIVTVRDNGPGIPINERENVLRRFYRLDHSRPGYGIGLASVAAIMQLHGGRLQLDDAKPGLAVSLEFPDGGATS